jgi:Bacterial pre-peptidase C-terminal domain
MLRYQSSRRSLRPRRLLSLRARLAFELLEDRTMMANGQWQAFFGGITPGPTLEEQVQYGQNLLQLSGVTEDFRVVEALDLSGSFVIETPASFTLSTLTSGLQNVPGFIFAQDFVRIEATPRTDIPGPTTRTGYESIYGPFNYDAFLAREAAGRVPNGSGLVTSSTTPTDSLTNNNTGSLGTSSFSQSETNLIAFDNTVLVGYNDAGSASGGANKFTGYSRSVDGGLTFTDGGTLPTNPGGDAGDPVLARDDTTGRIYFSTLGNTISTIQMFRSDDNGLTWLPPVNATPGGSSEDKQWHVVDNFAGPGSGNVYMISRRFGSSGGGPGIYFFRSTDGGSTFGPDNGTLITTGNQGAYVAVGPDHSVYAFWYAGTTLQVRKSVDQGMTFGAPVTIATFLNAGGTNGDLGLTGAVQGSVTASGFRSSKFPAATVNPLNGNVYVVYADDGAGVDKADVYFTQSTNGGVSWSVPVKVNDDATTTDQWQPTLAVSTDGSRVGVYYYSRQEDPANNNLFKYYGRIAAISASTVSFAPSFPVSNVPSLPEFGRDSLINPVYMGDYDSAVATPGFFHVSWSDSRDDLSGGAPRKDPNVYYEKTPLGLAVVSTTPVIGGVVSVAPTSFTVEVTDPVNAGTIESSDFLVNGIAADSFTYTPGLTTIAFSFSSSPVSVQGLQTIHIDAGAFTRTSDGGGVNVFDATFRYDTNLLQVASTVPTSGTGVFTLPGPFTYDVNFSEAIAAASLQTTDLVLSGIAGAFVSAVSLLPGNTTARFTLSGIASDAILTASIAAGAITDVFGNIGSAFTANYIVDIASTLFPVALSPRRPAGSLVYEATASGIVTPAGDSDSFTINVDAGQTITVIARPNTVTTLRPTITLLDPGGITIGTITAPAANQNAILQSVAANTSGLYTISISGAVSTIGNYSVQVLLNVAEELERNAGQATNSTVATAQNIDSSFLILSPTASRGAVFGTATSTNADFFSFTANAGDTISLAIQTQAAGTVNVALISPSNVSLATAVPVANFARYLNNLVALTSGVYRASVTATATTATPYILVVGKNIDIDREANNTFNTGQFLGVSDGVLGAVQNSAVVPSTIPVTEGNTSSSFPFHLGSVAGNQQRYQQLYTAAQLGAGGIIDTLRFRRNAGQAPFSTTGINVEITLSHSATTYSNMSSTFANNIGAGSVVVFNGLLNLSSNGVGTPNPFDIVVDVANTFTYLPTSGDLLVDIRVFNSPFAPVLFDASTSSQQSVTRQLIASGDANATTGTLSTDGLVTTFDFLSQTEDWQRFSVNVGDNLNLQTSTPASLSGEFLNNLNPKLELYEPSGNLVANGTVLGDGRNEQILFAAPVAGIYRSRVLGENSVGEYFLSVTGNSGTTAPAFTVPTINPASGARLSVLPGVIVVDFNDAVYAPSVQATDLVIDTAINAISVAQVDGNTWNFFIAGGLGEGTHTLSIAAGAILDVQQTPLTAFSSTFVFETVAPRVTGISILPNTVLPPGSLSYLVTFSEPMKVTNLSSDDFALHGNHRQAVGQNYVPTSFAYNVDGTVLTLNYLALPDDDYTLTLTSGLLNGTNFTDLAGNNLDGEFNGTLPSGNSTADGDFEVGFDLDSPTQPFSVLNAANPIGSLIYESTVSATITATSDVDEFTIDVDPNQTISIVVTPMSATFNPSTFLPRVELFDTTNSSVAIAVGDSPGKVAGIQPRATGAGGTYRVAVSGISGSQGLYSIQFILNAAYSSAGFRSSFVDLDATQSQVKRGAVLGTTSGRASYLASPIDPTFTDISATGTTVMQNVDDFAATVPIGFSFQFYGTSYTSLFVSDNGLVTFGTSNVDWNNQSLATSPTQAAIAVFWDDLQAINGANTATVKTELVGAAGSQQLIIQWDMIAFWPDNTATDTLTYQLIITEGTNTLQLNYLDLVSGTSFGNNGASATVGIKAEGITNQFLELAFNNGPNQFVGTGLSTLIVPPLPPSGPDYYKIDAVAGDRIHLALTNTGRGTGNVDLHLIASNETSILASGLQGAANVHELIQDFVAPTSGTYFARITGDGGVPYSLIVTKNSSIERESNNGSSLAQNLTNARGVLGAITLSTGSLVNASDSGYIAGDGSHTQGNNSYATGLATGTEYRNYGSFAIASDLPNILSAELRMLNPSNSSFPGFEYVSPDPTETYTLFDVSATPSELDTTRLPGDAIGIGLFADLGTGSSFGLRTVSSADNGTTISIPLNAAGLAALNAGRGQTISIGGAVTTLQGTSDQFFFTFATGATGTIQLVLQTESESDWYSIDVTSAGSILSLETLTPGGAAGLFVNNLNPKIELYDPSNTMVASGVVLADGRNELIEYTTLTTGVYRVRVVGESASIGEYYLRKNVLLPNASQPASVINRQVFYNRSSSAAFGNGSGNPINAIDPTKKALLPDETASVANFTNYSRGLNGIVVDIANATNLNGITDASFQFASWSEFTDATPNFVTINPTVTVSTFAGGGLNGSDRVKIEFPNNVIQNAWLQVTMLANADTGLTASDVFYFGNARFDVTPTSPFPSQQVAINSFDLNAVRAKQGQNPGAIANMYDVDRNGVVNAFDTNAVRAGLGMTSLRSFTAPASLRFGLASTKDSATASSVDSLFADTSWLEAFQIDNIKNRQPRRPS